MTRHLWSMKATIKILTQFFFFQLMIIKGLIVKFMKSLFVMREVGSHVDEILFSELAITILTYRTWCLYEELNILASDSMYFG